MFDTDMNIAYKAIRRINRTIRRVPVWYTRFYAKLRNCKFRSNFALAKALRKECE